MAPYIIKTSRLGLRNWTDDDLDAFAAINQNDEVMAYFPSKPDRAQTLALIQRMQKQFADHGYCYFAAELLDTKELIGFIGLCYQTYEAPFTPCTDIGWRLDPRFWGHGYATEGAEACLDYAFGELGLERVVAVAASVNIPSLAVMKRIGMEAQYTFDHPALLDNDYLRECWWYEIK